MFLVQKTEFQNKQECYTGFTFYYPANVSVHNGAKESIRRRTEILAAAVGRPEAPGSGQCVKGLRDKHI